MPRRGDVVARRLKLNLQDILDIQGVQVDFLLLLIIIQIQLHVLTELERRLLSVMAILRLRIRLLLVLTQCLKLNPRLGLLHLGLRLGSRRRRCGCRRLLELGTRDLLPRNESIDDIRQALVQENLNIAAIACLLLCRDTQRLKELRRLPRCTRGMLLELMDELGDRRTLEVQVHMSRLTLLLKHCKGTNVCQKDTHQEIIHVLAL